MRRTILVFCCFAPLITPGLAAAAQQPKPDDSNRLQTTSEANRDGLGGAVKAPLRDINVIRTQIPPVLLDAMADPYARPKSADCQMLTALIRPLDDALGPDLDIIPVREDEDLVDRGREWAGNTALGAVAGAASDMIPFRGWVRKLSGAEAHDRLVTAALAAGAIRRGYLKGLGEARGCNPPATPDHSRSELPPKDSKKKGPRFPIRLPGGAAAPAAIAVPTPAPIQVPGPEVAPEAIQPPAGNSAP
jgi:hypothetical protein